MLGLLRQAVVDQFADWRAECAEVGLAFEAWTDAKHARAGAFACYREALEREQHASEIYRDLLAEERRYCR